MKRVATFSRTSTELQHTSIDNQESIFNSWIAINKCILYRAFADEAISGTKANKRKQWLEMIQDAKDKKFDILLCKSYSRFGRNMIETLGAIKQLRENGIRVIFLEDGLDSELDSTKFGLFSWIAEQESQNTSRRIKMVFSHFNQIGKLYNCVPPYGYDYDKELNNFVINDLEATVVRRIFKMYLEGNGINKIASILHGEGVPTKKEGKWRGHTIKNIITNEVYVGTLVQNKSQTIDVTTSKLKKIDKKDWIKHYNSHAPIIDDETFLKVNKIFNKNSEVAKKTRSNVTGVERASNISLFSNLLKCSDCGATISIRRKKNRKLYYNCVQYERIGLNSGHQSNLILEEVLVDHVKNKLNKLVESKFDTIKIINNEDNRNELEKDLKNINRAIEKTITLSNNLLKLYSEGTINANQFKLQNKSISDTLDSHINNKNILEEKIKNIPHDNNVFKKNVESVVKVPVEDWSNAMLKKVISKIYISTNGTIKVKWIIEN